MSGYKTGSILKGGAEYHTRTTGWKLNNQVFKIYSGFAVKWKLWEKWERERLGCVATDMAKIVLVFINQPGFSKDTQALMQLSKHWRISRLRTAMVIVITFVIKENLLKINVTFPAKWMAMYWPKTDRKQKLGGGKDYLRKTFGNSLWIMETAEK